MTCGICTGIIHCDEVEAIRWLWSQDSLLQMLAPVADDITNRVYEAGKVSGDYFPYVVLRSTGDADRGPWGSVGIRITIFGRSKADVTDIVEAATPVLHACYCELCMTGAMLLWGRLESQGSGYRGKDIYFKQLLLRIRLSKEGT